MPTHSLTLAPGMPDLAALKTASSDYDIVRRAIAHIRGNWRSQPEIETVAEAAGVTKPVLYDHFGSKEGLLGAVVERSGQQMLDAGQQ